ncbi:MAG: lipopolysaccharide heptosyltransferase II [Planctomycetes bacterium]|nr:lipopolysaccharide heptosyltransferase II [Planctomycetota bacterium]
MSSFGRILIRSPNWVGDVVMATPAFRCVRESFPDARIVLAIRPYVKKIIDDAPWFDDVVPCDDAGGLSSLPAILAVSRRLRREPFDVAIVLPNSLKTAVEARLAGARRRVGYARDGRSWLLTDAIPRLARNGKFLPTYMGDYYLRLCERIGCTICDRRPELFVSEECERRTDGLLRLRGVDLGRPIALLNPGASFGPSKCWASGRFAEVGDRLVDEYGFQVCVSCSRKEVSTADEICSRMKRRGINLAAGKPPLELDHLKSLVKRCAILVTLDSGPRHFAVAFDRPVVTLMGPNSPLYTDTPLERGVVVRVDVDCGPCQEKVCRTDHRCMELLTSDMVFDACRAVLTY